MSFFGNKLLSFGIIPPTLTSTVTIVQRIILAIAITLTAADIGAAWHLIGAANCRAHECSFVAAAGHDTSQDRIWLVSTRRLPTDVCHAPLTNPAFEISRVDLCGNVRRSTLSELLDEHPAGQPVLFQVHGNRMSDETGLERGIFVYQQTVPHCHSGPLDYIIFSWPSDKEGILLGDGREKADRTDAQGLYLAWLVRELSQRDIPITMIGFSFGARIATGALHSLAGGRLEGRTLPNEHLRGINVNLGLIAPALEDDWLRAGNYHGLASQNIQQMSILYNQRDAVLKRYWLIDKVRGNMALGYTGPRAVAARFDGSPMPISACDCSTSLGIRHDEKKYYLEDCQAGRRMAKLVPH